MGQIIGKVKMWSAQPDVAKLLGASLGGGVTGAHCAAALRTCAPAYKVNVLKKLAPLIIDLEASRALIETQLSDWEQIVTRADLSVVQSV